MGTSAEGTISAVDPVSSLSTFSSSSFKEVSYYYSSCDVVSMRSNGVYCALQQKKLIESSNWIVIIAATR